MKRRFPDSSRMTMCEVAGLASGHSRASPRSLGRCAARASAYFVRSTKMPGPGAAGQSERNDGARAGFYDRGPPNAPPHHPGRALLPGHSARLNRQATLRPDAEMIDVEALIRQVNPLIVLARGPGSRIEKEPYSRSCAINGAVLARRSGSFSSV